MKWVWWGAAALLAIVLAVAGIAAVRTATFKPAGAPAAVELAAAPAFDVNAAAGRLSEAIRIQTISRTENVVEDPAAFAALHALLERSYPRTHAAMRREIVAGHSLLYTLPGSDASLPPILLMAHQDVVPVEAGTEGDWEAPPFSGEIKDGFVYGRGAADDKGSLISILEAMEALLARGFTPKRTVMFAFGHDEEVLGAGAKATADLIRERNIRPWFVLDEGMAVIEDHPLTGGPVALIGIAEKGYMTVRVTARAAGGHSSMPGADTAAERLARAILALRSHPFPGSLDDGPAPLMLEALAPKLPLMTRAAIANRWAFGGVLTSRMAALPSGNALLRTTIAPTMIDGGAKENVLPQEMHAIVNLRLHPRDSVESALAHLRGSVAGIEGVTIEPSGTPNNPSPVSSTTSDSYALIASAAAAHAPESAPVAPMLVLGATDSRHYVPIAENVYRYAPVWFREEDTRRVHGTGERMSVENIGRMVGFYAQVIETGSR
ncbi:MAG: M20 family peptidase [Hyphomonadaceae bacterium]|nr:M20 family peptidase [Hyphomonadaceae bacterium]